VCGLLFILWKRAQRPEYECLNSGKLHSKAVAPVAWSFTE
jgi:hypothetical protein